VGLSSFESLDEPFYQFTCSPLSCNLVAEEVPVNDYCLLTSLSACFSLAQEWSAANGVKAEPGDYVVAEVWTSGSAVTS
jgi:hypothetical protein